MIIRRSFAGSVVLLALVLTGCSIGDGTSQPAPTVTVTVTATPTPTPSGGSVPGIPEVIQTSGELDDGYDRTYACAASQTTFPITVGVPVKLPDGTSFTLTETNPDRAAYENQEGVVLEVTTGARLYVGALIIDTMAHAKRADLYPQAAVKVDVAPSETASFPFRTSTYSANYNTTGITKITVCANEVDGAMS